MAAPASKTITSLNGKWSLNKTLSDPTDPALALQGMGWLLRKAIGAANVVLAVTEYVDSETGKTHIDIEQTASGLRGTSEARVLDWQPREHKDWLFGRVEGRSKFVATLSELASLVAEDSEARKSGWVDSDFLALDWLEEEGGVIFNHVAADAGWFATQAWGFQDVGGERRYVRNVVVAKGGKFESFKMIYDFLEE
ncbi:hypothetical protein GGR51DRAFT_527942 [Nemania sp. FL0031]|nr:hypothetical protein GGR51DRAFT_527942 [Nemania sp. FL0031]